MGSIFKLYVLSHIRALFFSFFLYTLFRMYIIKAPVGQRHTAYSLFGAQLTCNRVAAKLYLSFIIGVCLVTGSLLKHVAGVMVAF